MRNLQWAGVLISLALAIYAIAKYRSRRYSRLSSLVGLLMAAGLFGIAIYPPVIDPLRNLLMMENRWFSVLFLAVVLLFVLYLNLLNKVGDINRNLGELVRALAKSEYQREMDDSSLRERTIFVVIPAYNEERAIRGVLAHIPKELLDYAIQPIVVVDGAEDNTEAIVRKEGHLVATHMVNRGQGDALHTGFDIAISQGADIVMTMDADGQHQASDMEQLVRPVMNDEADYVMGSRFLGEYEDHGGWRHAGILVFNKVIKLLGGIDLTDCTNGFRAIRAEGLAKLDLREDHFNAPELIMEAVRHGLRIKEVPVSIKRRVAGKSKKPPRLGYPLGFLATIIKVWLR